MIKLHIDRHSLKKSADNKITANIYFEINEVIFPEENWNDFVVVLLNFWIDELTKMSISGKSLGNFRFMDGPLRFSINHIAEFSVFKGFNQDSILVTENIHFLSFRESILIEASALVEDLHKKKWESDDVDSLKTKVISTRSATSR